MARQVRLQLRDGVATITLAGPDGVAGGGLDPALRAGLAEALDLTLADAGVRAVVLRGGGAGWPVAADPATDYAGTPTLRALAARIAAAPKPVVAVLRATMTGGALALAQAAQWRMADPETRFVAPEYGLGLLPAGSGMVRLARRIGAAAALDFALSEPGWDSAEAVARGMIDAVVEPADVDAAAADLARRLASGAPVAAARAADAALADPPRYLAELAAARAAFAPGPMRPVAARIADVAEAALLLPLEEALDFEAVAREDLAAAPLAAGLGHQASARRRAEALAGCAPLVLSGPLKIGLWQVPGGDDLALELLAAGHAVVLGATSDDTLTQGFSRIAHLQEDAVHAGRLDPDTREADWARLGAATDVAGLAGCDLVIAAAVPAGELRRTVGAAPVLALLGPGAPAELGLRLGAVSEVILPDDGFAAAAALLAAVLRETGHLVLRGGSGPGGITARLQAALFAAAERTVLAGARPADVDAALAAYGFAEPPFARADRIGLDRVAAALGALGRSVGPLSLYLIAEGQTGQARGQGIYRHDGARALPVPGQDELLAAIRSEAGIAPRSMPRAEILRRVLAELAGEGARMLQEGTAQRAGDIDLAAVHGLRLAARRGGPMFAADRAGLVLMRQTLRGLAAHEGAPPPVTLWDVLIKNGRRFADLDNGTA